MIDPEIIKTRYRAMTDGELTGFATEEGMGLTAEAFELLRLEFHARRLDTSVLSAIRKGTLSADKEAIRMLESSEIKGYGSTVLAHALNEKRDGKTDDAIILELIENGMEEARAQILVSRLEAHANKLLEKAKSNMFIGVFIFLAGVALRLIIPYRIQVTFMDIFSVCAILIGIIWFLKSLFERNKYGAVIKNILASGE